MTVNNQTLEMEVNLLLEAIFKKYGYDFRHYSRASLIRRIMNLQDKSNVNHTADMIPRILRDKEFLDDFLHNMSITVTFEVLMVKLKDKINYYSSIKY